MSRKQTVSQLFAKFASEETEIRARVEELNAELNTLTSRLAEVEVIRAALETANESSARRPARKSAAKKVTTKKAAAEKPAAAKKPASRARKGRRKAASGVHSMGIVEAAIFLAKNNGVTEADAGDVLGWFRDAGYKTRTGTPTRNSVYVSLNREAGTKRDTPRVTRPAKGRFAFHG